MKDVILLEPKIVKGMGHIAVAEAGEINMGSINGARLDERDLINVTEIEKFEAEIHAFTRVTIDGQGERIEETINFAIKHRKLSAMMSELFKQAREDRDRLTEERVVLVGLKERFAVQTAKLADVQTASFWRRLRYLFTGFIHDLSPTAMDEIRGEVAGMVKNNIRGLGEFR